MQRVCVLGATGSVGVATLDVMAAHPDRFEVFALTANRRLDELFAQCLRLRPRYAAVATAAQARTLADRLRSANVATEVMSGPGALCELAAHPDADTVMAAIVGAAGLKPTLEAVRQGTATALANKECLVSAGDIFMGEVARAGTTLLPVDSEHSAAFQAMVGTSKDRIERVCLTASGGPFRSWTLEQMKTVQPEQALNHPNWSMGPKVTIDSATLMNKGLELLEAHHLFALAPDKLDVLIHPQSIVHCLVHLSDGSVLAQLSCPDMRTPIAYSLAWPERMHAPTKRLDLAALGTLSFETPDARRFPALRLAREVLVAGGSAATVLNAANEIAVEAFLAKRIGFLAIASVVEETLTSSASLASLPRLSVEDVLAIDDEARGCARSLLSRFS